MSFKASIINNIGRLIAGGIISLVTMFFTWAITPVQVIVRIPETLEQMQTDFSAKQGYMIIALAKQREADSLLFAEICSLQKDNAIYQREIGIVKSKVNAVAGEFPELHRRFADIEEAVANQGESKLRQLYNNNINNLNFSSTWQMKNH